MLDEIWKDIEGYEGLYEISNKQRVRSIDRDIIYSNGIKHHITSQCCKKIKYRHTAGGYIWEYLERSD